MIIKSNTKTKKLKTAKEELGPDDIKLELIKSEKADEWNQFNSFCETMKTVMNEDKTLGETIKTISRKQGITIVSILSALGAIIAAIVGWVTKGTGATAASGEGWSGGGRSGEGGRVNNWAKKQLSALRRALK